MAFAGAQTMQRSAFFGSSSSFAAQSRPQRVAPPTALPIVASVIGPGKKWEHYDLNANGKPVRVTMHVRAGDLVKVIAGSDSGKIGKITRVNTKTGQVVVEGVNLRTKHVKPASKDESGQMLRREFPVHHSNVQVYSEAQGVVSRVGTRVENGVKVRFLKKTGEVLPNNFSKGDAAEEETK